MKRQITTLSLLISFMVTGLGMAQQKDQFVGHWKGYVILNNGAEDSLNVVITLKEGQLAGEMSDQYGLMDKAPMQNLKVTGNTFTCFVKVADTSGSIKIQLEAELDGNILEGDWHSAVNGSGDQWLLERVMKKKKRNKQHDA